MKYINSRLHGRLDLTVVVLLWLFPAYLNFTEFTAYLIYGIGLFLLILIIFTDYELGLFKFLPFPAHGIIEFLLALFLVISPWIFGLGGVDKVFLIILGLVIFILYRFTAYRPKRLKEEE